MLKHLTSALIVGLLACPPAWADPPAPPPEPQAAQPAGAFTTADQLLSALETVGSNITTLQGDLRMTKSFSEILGGDRQTHDGKLYFSLKQMTVVVDPAHPAPPPKPRRMFQVDFTSEIINNVKHDSQKSYLFDGEWFVERKPEQKQCFRRQIVPPGHFIDPLAIGEGPFPIPIGQKKSEILKRFDAKLLPASDGFAPGEFPPALADTYQLQLTPKQGTSEARQFKQVRLWYKQADLLPRAARTIDKDDSITDVFLLNLRMNKPVPPDVFDITCPPGWTVQDTPYRAPAPAAPDAPAANAPEPAPASGPGE